MGPSSFFQLKGLNLRARLYCRFGGWLYSEIIPRQYTAGTHPNTAAYDRQPFIYPNSVIEQADGSFVPNNTVLSAGDKACWDYEGKIQSNTAAKSDFLKLRELSISYGLPATLLGGQKFIKDATLGLVGTNLFIIRHADNDHGDPEYLYNSTDGYVSFRQVPPYRTYGFNVNLTF